MWSVTSVTIDVPGDTQVTLPTSPAPLTTAWLTCTPADVPLSIVTCVNHRLGSWPMTRADTGRLSARPCWLVEGDLVAELGLLAQLGLQLDVLRAQRVALLAQRP